MLCLVGEGQGTLGKRECLDGLGHRLRAPLDQSGSIWLQQESEINLITAGAGVLQCDQESGGRGNLCRLGAQPAWRRGRREVTALCTTEES